MTEDLPTGRGPPETYIGICKWVEDQLGLRVLTPEYEIVSVLFDVEKMTPLELRTYFSGSNTSFYSVLGDLEAKGALAVEPNPADRRSKHYRLSDHAEERLATQWQRYSKLGRDEFYTAGDPNEVISRYTRTIRSGLKVNQFTAEFQILLYVHATPGISNIQFSSFVDVSQSKFNESLRKLKKNKKIFFEIDEFDRRRKSYFLYDEVYEVLEELDRIIFSWLDKKVDRFEVSID